MCKEALELKEELLKRNYDIYNLTDNQIEEAAEILLDKFLITDFPVNIVQVADMMELELLKVRFKNNEDNHIGGALAISSQLTFQGYKKDKVIKVNKYNSEGHQRFTIVHEIYHFIFDFFFQNNPREEYYDIFYENSQDSNTIQEKRANRFAAAFLMPKNMFIKEYNYLKKVRNITNDDDIKQYLKNRFLVSEKAIEKRIQEVIM